MSRSQSSRFSSQNLMAAAVVALVVLSLAPARYTRWLDWFREVAGFFVKPVQHPMESLVRWVQGPVRGAGTGDPALDEMRRELDISLASNFQLQSRIERLEQLIREIQTGMSVNPDLPVKLIHAPVIGGGSDMSSQVLTVRAGRNDGVEWNSVAVVNGVQLVGSVRGVQTRTSDVVPITDRRAGRIQGQIMLSDTSRGPTCSLLPTEDGRLRGEVQWIVELTEQPEVRPGMTVRLADPEWPAHAHGLVLGTVESVLDLPQQPQRKGVIVAPTVRLSRVSEVLIRVLGEGGPGGRLP